MPFTGIEIAIVTIGTTSLLVSLSIAATINISFPEKIQNFVNQRKHNRRKKEYAGNLFVCSRTAPIPFAAICSYLSENRRLKTNRSGRQYMQININSQINNFNIPETDADVYLKVGGGTMIFNVQGEHPGSPVATAFNVYWDTEDVYQYFVREIQVPFCEKATGTVTRELPKDAETIYSDKNTVSAAAETVMDDLLG